MPEKSKKTNSSASLVDTIVDCALDKKAEKLIVLEVNHITSLTDYFIICSANTEPQIKAICDSIRKGTPHKPWHIEGYEKLSWNQLDKEIKQFDPNKYLVSKTSELRINSAKEKTKILWKRNSN